MFSLTQEQEMIVAATARAVGEKFGLDYWRKLDAAKDYPAAFWQEVCAAGLSGIALPEKDGGGGLGMFEMALVVEALAAAGGGSTVGQLFMLNPIFGGVSLSRFASAALREQLLPRLMLGELCFCMALTEPDAGTNTLEIRSFASADGQGWRLNGSKIWITAVPNAGKMLIVARTKKVGEARSRTDGISMFLIDVDRAGVSHSAIEKLGTNTLPSSSVQFAEVRIEPEELIGTLHSGWNELLDVLNTERIVTTAGLIGTCELAIRLAVDYAKDRKIFDGKPIASHQGLQFPLAQAHAQTEAARLVNYDAASRFDRGLTYGSQANIAKLLAAQAAAAATERSMQTMGGMGFAKDFHVERLWRDCRLFRFAPISEEMILNFIAVHDLGMPRGY
jgi:acyl-CoA dehydrogenase